MVIKRCAMNAVVHCRISATIELLSAAAAATVVTSDTPATLTAMDSTATTAPHCGQV